MSKRKKPKAKPKSKRARLEGLAKQMSENELLENHVVVYEPAGEVKMSAALGTLIEPYMDMAETAEAYDRLVALGVIAWNAALQPEAKRRKMLNKIIDQVIKEPADNSFAKTFIQELIARKEALFPHIKRYIVDYQITETRWRYHLSVASTLSPKS